MNTHPLKDSKDPRPKDVKAPQPHQAPKPEPQCCCDYSAYCPAHSKNGRPAYKFDPDSYIAGGS